MNKKIYLTLVIAIVALSLRTFADGPQLPQSWINPEVHDEKNVMQEELSPSKSATEHFSKMVDFDQQLAESALDNSLTKERGRGHWFLHTVETKLGLEPSGTIGPIGVKGETMIKLHWKRTAASLAALGGQRTKDAGPVSELSGQDDDQYVGEESLQFSGDELSTDLEVKLMALAKNLENHGNISNHQNFMQQILPLAKEYAQLAKAINQTSDESHWIPFRLQLDINVEAEGNINPLVSIGGGTRIRLEWSRHKKVSPKNINMLKPVDLANIQMIEAIAQDFNELSATKVLASTFQLDNIKVGIGLSAKGNIFVAKSKAGVRASLIFKRAPNSIHKTASATTNPRSDAPISLGILKNEKGHFGWNYSLVDRKLLRGQLQKVLAMATFFTRNAETTNRSGSSKKFELRTMELELQMGAKGTIGLVTVEGTSVLELVLNKRQ